ncbi:Smr/MutS family protein [Candidatus Albibeggiatoa sp. nov. NOAA]|uniref:Smr/MutS family protein n=1 Tax=Candidatus Albibeggiatoa sp. nov. NOAA TaxID=3162724 RepID=UPI0032FE9486|nr:Smr/MutS family protein [Thiotrichaceae bacterium]
MSKQPLDETDVQTFRQAMQNLKGLKPIQCDVIKPEPKKVAAIPRQREQEVLSIRDEMMSDKYDPYDLETGEELVFMRKGVQRSVLRKLRRGHYSVNAELDLHGMIVPEAREAVAYFLHECQINQYRCVRIVHGKGYGSWNKLPVLKGKLSRWLQQRDEVLAFCSARQFDGGTGAVYVLLKRN